MAASSGPPTRSQPGRRIAVVIADDDDAMRRAMGEALAVQQEFEVVAEVADGRALIEVVAAVSPDLVVLDVRMPGGGATAARRLGEGPHPPVVVAVSATTDVRTVTAMVRAGASGFLAKGELGQTFAQDLARVARGHVVIAVPKGVQVLRALVEPTAGDHLHS